MKQPELISEVKSNAAIVSFIEDGKMYVSEVFRKNGKITFGFVDPIIYEKKSN